MFVSIAIPFIPDDCRTFYSDNAPLRIWESSHGSSSHGGLWCGVGRCDSFSLWSYRELQFPITLYVLIPAMIYFNAVIYKEVRRNGKQIISNRVSSETKEKMLKNKKSFHTTLVKIPTIFLCFIPTNICLIILDSFTDRIPNDVRVVVKSLVTLLPLLNLILGFTLLE